MRASQFVNSRCAEAFVASDSATREDMRTSSQETRQDKHLSARELRLDISCIDERLARTLDSLIASEVLKHVAPPVARAFVNAARSPAETVSRWRPRLLGAARHFNVARGPPVQ